MFGIFLLLKRYEGLFPFVTLCQQKLQTFNEQGNKNVNY